MGGFGRAVIGLCTLLAWGLAAKAAYLGLVTTDSPVGGARVAQAAPGGPAALAGFQPNDIILSVDGRPIANADAFVAAVKAKPAGAETLFDVVRAEGGTWRRLALRAVLTAGPDAPTGPSRPAATASTPVTGWTRVAEPSEQAFTFELPTGWRYTASAPLLWPTASFAASAPDSSVFIGLNDPRWLPMHYFALGGAPARPDWRNYLPAPYFILAFGATLVAEQCEAPTLVRLRLRNDIADTVQRLFPALGTPNVFTGQPGALHAADAVFMCRRAGRESMAYLMVLTRMFAPGPTFGTWHVESDELIVAPREQLVAAGAILGRAFGSIAFSDAWLQKRGAQEQGQSHAAIHALDATLHESHQIDNIVNGVGDYFNPATEQIVQPPLGFDRYCQDALGITFGENGTYLRPNCQQLQPVK